MANRRTPKRRLKPYQAFCLNRGEWLHWARIATLVG